MNERVLIVDDSLTVRMDLAETFQRAGFEAVPCGSIEAARGALAGQPCRLAILDVLLPDGDGVELLAELKGSAPTSSMPVVLLSSEAEVKDRIRGMQTGADEYVAKPYDPSYLVRRARTLLSREQQEGDSATVLVIDDSPTFREELGQCLRDAGFAPVLASNGEEGLERAADSCPDAIIVDGVMPDLDGTAVVRRIRLDPVLHKTPCLLLTAAEDTHGEVVALDAGADAYVRKQEGPQMVLARLGATLRSTDPGRERPLTLSVLGPKKILCVDDSLTYLEMLAEHLKTEGYDVIKARSGEAAMDLLGVEPVDAILLDLLMPGLSGTETCKKIKGSPALKRVPLIMLTALEEQQAMIEGINAGADDYVAKSADFNVLKARLRAQLRRKQFDDENRRFREEVLRQEAETRAALQLAETKQELLSQLEDKNTQLERYAAELEGLNEELRTFAYSVSHDLRQPLRSMDGFSNVVLERCGPRLEAQERHYLERIRAGAKRMGNMIDGLLALSRVGRRTPEPSTVRLDEIAERIVARLQEADPERRVATRIVPRIEAWADPQLIESALENLLGNAWKFTRDVPEARIEIGVLDDNSDTTCYVRDNGAGFDMAYADKLFGPFQRLHSERVFEGTGIGLATVQRIVRRHGGRIWAEAAPNNGATFFFTLPNPPNSGGTHA